MKVFLSVLVVLLFAIVCFLFYIIFSGNQKKSEDVKLDDVPSTNEKKVGTDDSNDKKIIYDLSNYSSEYVSNNNIKHYDDSLSKDVITAYKDNKVVWEYSTGDYVTTQYNEFRVILAVDNHLYVQFMHDLIILDLDNGNVISSLENFDIDVNFTYLYNNYLFLSFSKKLSIDNVNDSLSIIDVNSNTIFNT